MSGPLLALPNVSQLRTLIICNCRIFQFMCMLSLVTPAQAVMVLFPGPFNRALSLPGIAGMTVINFVKTTSMITLGPLSIPSCTALLRPLRTIFQEFVETRRDYDQVALLRAAVLNVTRSTSRFGSPSIRGRPKRRGFVLCLKFGSILMQLSGFVKVIGFSFQITV